jgi:CRP-like cAMP-binding protein
MKNRLKEFILGQVKYPNESEINEILDLFEEKHFKKGEFFKKPHTTGKHLAFLSKGAVRTIIFKENGEEITACIREDNSFITDPFRLDGKDNSPLGIECLEDLTLLVAPIDKALNLLDTNLMFNIVIRQHIRDQMLIIGQRQLLFLTGTAKERYQYILENNPSLLKKVPLRFIASLIGITPTQLSRVRNKK